MAPDTQSINFNANFLSLGLAPLLPLNNPIDCFEFSETEILGAALRRVDLDDDEDEVEEDEEDDEYEEDDEDDEENAEDEDGEYEDDDDDDEEDNDEDDDLEDDEDEDEELNLI